MRTYSDEGIVLKRLDIGEADRLVTFFTLQNGKKAYIAKGVRKISSKRGSSLELFNHIKFSAIKSKTDIDIVGEVHIINSFSSWRQHLGRVTLAYQLAEAIDKLTPENESHPDLFYLLLSGLDQIGKLGSDWEKRTESWLIDVMKSLGFWSDEEFTGDIYSFIESISDRNFQSAKLLHRLRT